MFGAMKTLIKNRKDYQSWKKGYYHLSSDGWQEGKLFNNEQQFAFGMTLMGLITLRFEIVIYDFTLMDNHFHILMSGKGADCVGVFDYLKKKLSARLIRDGFPPLPEDYGFKLTPVKDEEQMRINFLYLDRNPFERGLCVPVGYPWGSAYLHYSELGECLEGVPASSLSGRKMELLTGSRTPVPGHWKFNPQLGLLPESFVDNSLFERLFSGPKDYQTRLVKESEAFVKLGASIDDIPVFSQLEMNDIAEMLARELFPGKRLRTLSQEEKGRLCLPLEERYLFTPTQIAETLSLPEYLVKQLLSSKDYGKRRR